MVTGQRVRSGIYSTAGVLYCGLVCLLLMCCRNSGLRAVHHRHDPSRDLDLPSGCKSDLALANDTDHLRDLDAGTLPTRLLSVSAVLLTAASPYRPSALTSFLPSICHLWKARWYVHRTPCAHDRSPSAGSDHRCSSSSMSWPSS